MNAVPSDQPARPRRVRHRRGRKLPGYLVVLIALGAIGGLYSLLAPGAPATTTADQSKLVAEGHSLFLSGCSTCHGLQAQGVPGKAPSLIGVGAAAVDFQVSTGRMPLQIYGPQAPAKQPKYPRDQIDALAAYVASLAPGPAIPQVNASDGDLAKGGELFRTNCASCHNFAGSGGALTYGKYAPDLAGEPLDDIRIAEAIRTGPEQMPVFAASQLSDSDVNSIVAYVNYLKTSDNPGGNGLGRLGPVSEGLVAWLIGITVLVAVTMWIGSRA